MRLVREYLASNGENLLNDSVSFERGVRQDLAGYKQNESNDDGDFHEKWGGVRPSVPIN